MTYNCSMNGSGLAMYNAGYLILSLLISLCIGDVAWAEATATENVLDEPLCQVLEMMTGTTGKVIGSLCIGTMAAGALFGKLSPTTTMVGCGALAGVLGAPQLTSYLASAIGGTEDFGCEDSGGA